MKNSYEEVLEHLEVLKRENKNLQRTYVRKVHLERDCEWINHMILTELY